MKLKRIILLMMLPLILAGCESGFDDMLDDANIGRAALQSATISVGSISPAFNRGVTSYIINESSTINTVTLTTVPAKSDAKMQYRIDGGAWADLAGSQAVTGIRTASNFTKKYEVQVTSGDGKGIVLYTFTVKGMPFAIGDSYGGGKIAYILQLNDNGFDANIPHGLIAATADQNGGSGREWSNLTASVSTDGYLGSGETNTNNIISQNEFPTLFPRTTYAAGIARSYTDGIYTDWYLPSNDELLKLYENKIAIGGFVIAGNIYYWSSTQLDSDPNNAYCLNFTGTGNTATTALKVIAPHRIRAVRSF